MRPWSGARDLRPSAVASGLHSASNTCGALRVSFSGTVKFSVAWSLEAMKGLGRERIATMVHCTEYVCSMYEDKYSDSVHV